MGIANRTENGQYHDERDVSTSLTKAGDVTTKHITVRITRTAKYNLQKLSKEELALRMNAMRCAATIKANTKIVRKRMSVQREHINKKVACAAKQDTMEKVLLGKM